MPHSTQEFCNSAMSANSASMEAPSTVAKTAQILEDGVLRTITKKCPSREKEQRTLRLYKLGGRCSSVFILLKSPDFLPGLNLADIVALKAYSISSYTLFTLYRTPRLCNCPDFKIGPVYDFRKPKESRRSRDLPRTPRRY